MDLREVVGRVNTITNALYNTLKELFFFKKACV